MNKEVNFEIAKLLKEKGFSWECRHFYSKSKYDKEFYLKTGTEYESDRDCIWDWNLNGGKSGMLSKIIPYPNDSDAIYYSAPTIAEVVMWLYENHDIWIVVDEYNNDEEGRWFYNWKSLKTQSEGMDSGFTSPTESYEAAIIYVLTEKL